MKPHWIHNVLLNLTLLATLALSNTTAHASDELLIGIAKASNAEALSKIRKDMSFVDQREEEAEYAEASTELTIIEHNDTESGEDNLFIRAEDYETETFNTNDYIVICFTPPISLHLRIMDTAPNGKQSLIFPSDGSVARKVKGGQRYCVGDENSDTRLRMDAASGTGLGTVWIIGTASESQASKLTVDQFSLPETGSYGKSPAGSTKISAVNKIEGWVNYAVQ